MRETLPRHNDGSFVPDHRTRRQKLLDMANHPRSDPNEAKVARELAAKLDGPKPPPDQTYIRFAHEPEPSPVNRPKARRSAAYDYDDDPISMGPQDDYYGDGNFTDPTPSKTEASRKAHPFRASVHSSFYEQTPRCLHCGLAKSVGPHGEAPKTRLHRFQAGKPGQLSCEECGERMNNGKHFTVSEGRFDKE